jgi:hypothetical protein
MVGGKLEMIGRTGCLGPSTSIAAPSVQNCIPGLPAVLAPPVSASTSRVYFRDGDAKIRYMTPDGQVGDSTTVPGGPTTASFFAVSPDDKRIAVVVEDLSAAATIGLRLYVEDLTGGGHHADTFVTTIQKSGGVTLWPMGWHQGSIILAVVLACSLSPVSEPYEWHVVDATTATRLATLPGSKVRCLGGFWQSPAGAACSVDNTTFVNDWSGKPLSQDMYAFGPTQAQLSPSNTSAALDYNGPDGWGGDGVHTSVINIGQRGMTIMPGHASCLWIDDTTLLAPDAVIAYQSGLPPPGGSITVTSNVTALPAAGLCMGRFPGGL